MLRLIALGVLCVCLSWIVGIGWTYFYHWSHGRPVVAEHYLQHVYVLGGVALLAGAMLLGFALRDLHESKRP